MSKKNNQKTKKVTKVKNYNLKNRPKDWFKVLLEETPIQTENGNSLVYPMVCETTLHEYLEKFPKNRDVINSHIRTIGGSCYESGYILRYPVIVEYLNHYYKVDGQHLIQFCANEKLPTRFFLCKVKTMQHVKTLCD